MEWKQNESMQFVYQKYGEYITNTFLFVTFCPTLKEGGICTPCIDFGYYLFPPRMIMTHQQYLKLQLSVMSYWFGYKRSYHEVHMVQKIRIWACLSLTGSSRQILPIIFFAGGSSLTSHLKCVRVDGTESFPMTIVTSFFHIKG